jgi:N-acetylglutamate synthase-like GNAT family acetyltransferase
MQHGYVLTDNDGDPIRCTASLLHLSPHMSLLSGVEVAVNLRGRGNGTRLLKLVLADADKEGVTLVLSVGSDDSPLSLSNLQLADWYERHGFRVIDGKTASGLTMQRIPRTGASG